MAGLAELSLKVTNYVNIVVTNCQELKQSTIEGFAQPPWDQCDSRHVVTTYHGIFSAPDARLMQTVSPAETET